ncbi:MAG: hypothetical protein M3Y93_11755 [Pseudomonadota bacterium]|nr:hypothetical protein [Pseudomonadota bacterium]
MADHRRDPPGGVAGSQMLTAPVAHHGAIGPCNGDTESRISRLGVDGVGETGLLSSILNVRRGRPCRSARDRRQWHLLKLANPANAGISGFDGPARLEVTGSCVRKMTKKQALTLD